MMNDKPEFTVNSDSIFTFSPVKPSYNIRFYRDGGEQVGELDFNGPAMKFTGNAEESAKVFFDYIAAQFAQRLEEEREAAKRA